MKNNDIRYLRIEGTKALSDYFSLKERIKNNVYDNDVLSNDDKTAYIEYIENLFLEFNFKLQRTQSSGVFNTLVIPITNVCNLNCKGCDVYAPLCNGRNRSDYPKDRLCADIDQLYKLGFSIIEVSIEGGEPFLNTELYDIVSNLRKISDYHSHELIISILTNGLLLDKVSDIDLLSIKDNDAILIIDKYVEIPNFSNVLSRLDKMGIKYGLDGCIHDDGWFHRAPLDLTNYATKEQSANHTIQCEKGNNIITMDHGLLYKCGRCASIKHFNSFFKKELSDIGIDIYAHTKKEIADFLTAPSPLCKYCLPFDEEGKPWCRSSKDISEWANI